MNQLSSLRAMKQLIRSCDLDQTVGIKQATTQAAELDQKNQIK